MTTCTFGQYSSYGLQHNVCTAISEPVSHNSVREKMIFYLGSLRLGTFKEKAQALMIQDKTKDLFCTFSCLPTLSHINLALSHCSLTPVSSNLQKTPPRWRFPQRRRRLRRVSAQAGRADLSAGTKGLAGPLSRLAPGGCAGSSRPLWASASDDPGTPPGLATALHAPSLVSAPWGGGTTGEDRGKSHERLSVCLPCCAGVVVVVKTESFGCLIVYLSAHTRETHICTLNKSWCHPCW